MSQIKKRKPALGFWGLLIAVVSFLLMVITNFHIITVLLFLAGVILIIYALATGHTKFLG